MGQGNLQEMPVKITKTVVDSGVDNSPVEKSICLLLIFANFFL